MARSGSTSDFWLRLLELIGPRAEKMTQDQIGKYFGVGQSMATRWKTGKDKPGLTRARSMAKKHHVTTDWLLDGIGSKHPGAATDPYLARLLEFWPTLTPDKKREVVNFALYQSTLRPAPPPEEDLHRQPGK